jgi:hypothetical protein
MDETARECDGGVFVPGPGVAVGYGDSESWTASADGQTKVIRMRMLVTYPNFEITGQGAAEGTASGGLSALFPGRQVSNWIITR